MRAAARVKIGVPIAPAMLGTHFALIKLLG